jgi:hypothetical protein
MHILKILYTCDDINVPWISFQNNSFYLFILIPKAQISKIKFAITHYIFNITKHLITHITKNIDNFSDLEMGNWMRELGLQDHYRKQYKFKIQKNFN